MRFLLIIGVTVVIGIAALREAGQKYVLDRERESLDRKAEEFDARNRVFKEEVANLQDSSNLEIEVRRKLHLKKPWEHVIFFADKEATTTQRKVLEETMTGKEDALPFLNPGKWLEYFFPE